MTLGIRPAVPADQPTIEHLVKVVGELFPFGLSWEHFLIAEQDGIIIGCGQIRQHGAVNELGSLVVLEEYRGKGVGRQLIGALEAKAGFPLYLFCNVTIQQFYEQFSYRCIRFPEVPGSLRRTALLFFTMPRLFGSIVCAMCKNP